jgi:hypothetical protein
MTVRTYHHISREDKTLLREEGMFDPCLPDFEIMGEVLSLCKLPEHLALLCRKYIFSRSEMVRD